MLSISLTYALRHLFYELVPIPLLHLPSFLGSLSCCLCRLHLLPVFSVCYTLMDLVSTVDVIVPITFPLLLISLPFQLVFLRSSQLTATPSHALPSCLCPCHLFGEKTPDFAPSLSNSLMSAIK